MAKAFIPSMIEWKALPLKEDRKTILGKLREQVGDPAIVEAWGVTANSYYTTLMSYGFPTKGVMETLGASHPRPPKGKKRVKKEVEPIQTEQQTDEPIRGSVPSDRNWPRSSNVIEVEHKVMPKVIDQEITPWRGHNIDDTERPLQLPFPSLRGTPAQLLKQFEALVLFLSALDEDSVRYEVHIGATKQ